MPQEYSAININISINSYIPKALAPDLREVALEGRIVPARQGQHDVVQAAAADGGALVPGGVHEVRQQPGEADGRAPGGERGVRVENGLMN